MYVYTVRERWWEKARLAHVRYAAQHTRDVRLWPHFFEHKTGIEARNLELICHSIFNDDMDAVRAHDDTKKRFDRVAVVLGRGRYFLFVLLGPAVCRSASSLKKISAAVSSSSGGVSGAQIVAQVWESCLARHDTDPTSAPAPTVADVTVAISGKLNPAIFT